MHTPGRKPPLAQHCARPPSDPPRSALLKLYQIRVPLGRVLSRTAAYLPQPNRKPDNQPRPHAVVLGLTGRRPRPHTLKLCTGKDFAYEVVAPAASPAFRNGEALAAGMLLQQ